MWACAFCDLFVEGNFPCVVLDEVGYNLYVSPKQGGREGGRSLRDPVADESAVHEFEVLRGLQ